VSPLLISTIWSFRKELIIVSSAFLLTLLIPVIAVILLTNSGIDIISDRLATKNSKTKAVAIHDPATGKVISTIDVNTSWPTSGVITLEFGEPHLPYQLFHSGIDIASPNGKVGDPVTAFMPGKVIYAGEISWGFGKHIIINHGNNITSIYAHLDKIYAAKDQEIKTTDQVIGLEGDTGWSTGPHLHFQINVYGIPVNPRTFLPGNP
jgi:murein DD-endopeptidase MepM/ murein hydrolase activator NlpD